MKISELPQDIKEKALEYQREYGRNLETDYLDEAFLWFGTAEGHEYWQSMHESEIKQPTPTNQLRQLKTDTITLQQLWSDGVWRDVEIVTI